MTCVLADAEVEGPETDSAAERACLRTPWLHGGSYCGEARFGRLVPGKTDPNNSWTPGYELTEKYLLRLRIEMFIYCSYTYWLILIYFNTCIVYFYYSVL